MARIRMTMREAPSVELDQADVLQGAVLICLRGAWVLRLPHTGDELPLSDVDAETNAKITNLVTHVVASRYAFEELPEPSEATEKRDDEEIATPKAKRKS